MEIIPLFKALADETRFKILQMLLQHNYCVRALSRNLGLSEAAISQHLKVLREAGLLVGQKKGYFMHYEVERTILNRLASQINELAAIKRETCIPEKAGCEPAERGRCHVQKINHKCSDEIQSVCHCNNGEEVKKNHHGNCQCHKS